MSDEKILEILNHLSSLDYSRVNFDPTSRLRRNIDLIFRDYVITGRFIPIGNGRYHRSILYSEKPLCLNELKYPPAEKASLSRANMAGKPVFYCSGDPRSTVFEMKIKVGDTFVLSKWTCKREIPVLPMGYTSECFVKLKSNRDCPLVIPYDQRHSLESRPLNMAITDFLNTKFTDPISHENNKEYLLTAMIAEYFLLKYNSGDCGIAYPTIAMRGNADNFVFPPEVMDKSFNFYTGTWYKVDEVDCNALQFKVSKLAIAKSLNKEDRLIWENIPHDEPHYL